MVSHAGFFVFPRRFSMATSPQQPLPVLLTKKDLAFQLRVSDNHIDALERTNRLPPSIKMGSGKRWKSTEILDWIEAGCPRRSEDDEV